MVDVDVKPCKYILNKEECPYGSRCRYGHGSFENPNIEAEGGTLTKAPQKQNNPQTHKERENFKQKNCYFYLHSHCRYGNRCTFKHPKRSGIPKNKPVDHKPETVPSEPEPTEVTADERAEVNTSPPQAEPDASHIDTATDGSVKQDSEKSAGKRRWRANYNQTPAHQVSRNRQRVRAEPEELSNSKESTEKPGMTRPREDNVHKGSTRPREENVHKGSTRPREENVHKGSTRPREGNVHKGSSRDGNARNSEVSGRSRKTEGYQSHSAAPPPLTLESFLTRQPVKRPQRNASRQKEVSKSNLREIELEQLQVRFPGDNCELLEKSKDSISYLVHFQPSDPEWHGPETILLRVTFPEDYPDKYCSVELSTDQDILPEAVEVFNMAAESYWSSEMRGTLMFRPFLHWMDKNIAELLHIQPKTRDALDRNEGSEVEAGSDTDSSSSGQEDGEMEMEESENKSSVLVKSKKGTEIRLIGLNTSQNLGTAYWSVISVVLACNRCKSHKQVELKEERGYSVVCDRCNCSYTAIYHLALIHASSFTLGYLELSNCSPVDVVFQSSSLTMTCLNCSCGVTSAGFFIDQSKDEYCRRCHSKMSISASGIRFLQHQQMDTPTSLSAGNMTVLPASGKRAQAELFKDGNPLPEYGVCQHYKKSHRWLRFPCCGRAFPCDICHDAAQDHPMDRATRMICGYCSKEQGYSTKGECVRCGADLISSKTTSHWEGGQGCRNKVKMNRLDKHKYKNSDGKTASKKAERVGKKSS